MNTQARAADRELPAHRTRTALLLGLNLLGLALTGCRETHIRSYVVPSERAERAGSPMTPQPGGAPAPMTQATAGEGPVVPHWHLPAGWQEVAGSGMRYATIVVEPGEAPLEIRVTPLALAARDPLENVNRWRGQIGLDPIGQSELGSVMKSATVAGFPVEIVNMTGVAMEGKPPGQILAAMLTTDSQVWFFLMLDKAERVAKHAAAFEAFIRDLHMSGDPEPTAHGGNPAAAAPGGMPPGGASAAPPGAPAGETMTWTAPADWARDATAGDMRVATFKLPDAAGEVTITKFPGDVGGLMANINRWRKQLDMPPVSSPAEQPAESMSVAGQAAQLYDIVQPGAAATRKRMLVVLLPRPDMTWFIKMTGDAVTLDRQSDAFRTFVKTIQMRGGA